MYVQDWSGIALHVLCPGLNLSAIFCFGRLLIDRKRIQRGVSERGEVKNLERMPHEDWVKEQKLFQLEGKAWKPLSAWDDGESAGLGIRKTKGQIQPWTLTIALWLWPWGPRSRNAICSSHLTRSCISTWTNLKCWWLMIMMLGACGLLGPRVGRKRSSRWDGPTWAWWKEHLYEN